MPPKKVKTQIKLQIPAGAANPLLNDYRSGALGRISLESPASRAARPVSSSNNNDALPESADQAD